MKECPGKKLVDVLEALDPINFMKVSETADRDPYQRIRNGFPNLSNDQLGRLYGLARIDLISCKATLARIQAYSENGSTGNLLMDAAYGLGTHVQNCRAEGFCLEGYMVWLMQGAEEDRKEKGLDEEDLPSLIIERDSRVLNILAGN
jgi:hypothetical protein